MIYIFDEDIKSDLELRNKLYYVTEPLINCISNSNYKSDKNEFMKYIYIDSDIHDVNENILDESLLGKFEIYYIMER